MQNFVIAGKAKNVFKTIKLMAQAEKEEKKWGKPPKNPSVN
ncbi:hypothetical protein ACFLVH_05580 [Chloroflexota bacterium]